MPNLKWIVCRSHGFDNINLAECEKRGIGVLTTKPFTQSTADWITDKIDEEYAKNIEELKALLIEKLFTLVNGKTSQGVKDYLSIDIIPKGTKFTMKLLQEINFAAVNPVKWTTQIEKKSNGNYVLTFNGTIENGWHLYSQFTAEGGSLPLEILFKNQKGNFELIGQTKESKTKTAYNDIFEVDVLIHK